MTRKKPISLRRLPALLGSLALALTGAIAAAPPAHATPTTDGMADIAITQVNAPQDGIYAVGDVMTFDIAVTNTSDQERSFAPTSTNLSGGVSKCRWRSIAARATKTDCTGLATHTVTAEDIAAGGFTPEITYEIKAPGYSGAVLNTPESIKGATSPVTAASLRVESFTPASPKDSYTVGETVSYTVRVRSLSTQTITVGATGSSFDDLGSQCDWRNLAPGERAVYNCKALTHTLTQADADYGTWTPQITLTATGPDGALLQTLTASGQALTVVADRPQAEPAEAPNADPGLEAFLTDPQQLAANTATDNYRIPAIATAPNGDLLVSYDERPKDNGNGGGDAPNPNHIVQRRSTDGGQTWSAPTYIHQGTETGQKVGYSDPSYVVDYATGTIFNFHVKSYDQGWGGSRAGTDPEDRGVIHAEVSTSTDNGWSWTHRTITAEITPDASWISRFAASGQGIQIQRGEHAGRLVQQYTIKTSSGQVSAVSVYSDDHGASWHAGRPAGTGMDENKVVELSDGTLMLNSRVSDGSGYRKVATSTDGGQTWSEPRSDTGLPDSVDNAQIIRAFPGAAPDDPRAKVLLLSHSPNPVPWSRDRGTISMSCDDGATWATSRIFNEAFIGYSTIAVQANGSIGLLSEDGNYGGIWYRSFSTAWLDNACTQVRASARASAPSISPGSEATVTVTLTNPGGQDLTGVSVGLPQVEGVVEGITVTPSGAGPDTVAAGGEATYEFTVSTAGAAGRVELVFPIAWDGGTAQASVSLDSAPGPAPSPAPSPSPSAAPGEQPTAAPTAEATSGPSGAPTDRATDEATAEPSTDTTGAPSAAPDGRPTQAPSLEPSRGPEAGSSTTPGDGSTAGPAVPPSDGPGGQPSPGPSRMPDDQASSQPSAAPTRQPSAQASTPGPQASASSTAPSPSASSSTQPEEINRPSDGAMAQPTPGGGQGPAPSPSVTASAASGAPSSSLARTGAALLPGLGLAAIALLGGYLVLRARRSRG